MTIRISLNHYGDDEATDGEPLLIDVLRVDPYGQVTNEPLRQYQVTEGNTVALHLAPGQVFVVRRPQPGEL